MNERDDGIPSRFRLIPASSSQSRCPGSGGDVERGHAPQLAAVGAVVERARPVHGGPVVVDDEVPGPPLVRVHELALRRVLHQLAQQQPALGQRPAKDARRVGGKVDRETRGPRGGPCRPGSRREPRGRRPRAARSGSPARRNEGAAGRIRVSWKLLEYRGAKGRLQGGAGRDRCLRERGTAFVLDRSGMKSRAIPARAFLHRTRARGTGPATCIRASPDRQAGGRILVSAAAVSSLSRVFCRPAASKFSGASHRS